MSNDTQWTFLHNQLNDLKKLVARLQREITIMKRLIGLDGVQYKKKFLTVLAVDMVVVDIQALNMIMAGIGFHQKTLVHFFKNIYHGELIDILPTHSTNVLIPLIVQMVHGL